MSRKPAAKSKITAKTLLETEGTAHSVPEALDRIREFWEQVTAEGGKAKLEKASIFSSVLSDKLNYSCEAKVEQVETP